MVQRIREGGDSDRLFLVSRGYEWLLELMLLRLFWLVFFLDLLGQEGGLLELHFLFLILIQILREVRPGISLRAENDGTSSVVCSEGLDFSAN